MGERGEREESEGRERGGDGRERGERGETARVGGDRERVEGGTERERVIGERVEGERGGRERGRHREMGAECWGSSLPPHEHMTALQADKRGRRRQLEVTFYSLLSRN